MTFPQSIKQKLSYLNAYLGLYFVIALALSTLAACSSISSKITAAPDINPDINGTPSPVAMSIFELSDPVSFEGSTFFNLYGNAKQSLGSTLLHERDLMITPGQTLKVSIPYVQGAHFVAYIAAFRNLQQVEWQGITAINQDSVFGNEIMVLLDQQGLHIVPSKQDPS